MKKYKINTKILVGVEIILAIIGLVFLGIDSYQENLKAQQILLDTSQISNASPRFLRDSPGQIIYFIYWILTIIFGLWIIVRCIKTKRASIIFLGLLTLLPPAITYIKIQDLATQVARPILYKPVLYLYPKEKTVVTISFEHPEDLLTTYPKYNTNWQVTALPSGDLYDKKGNYYYALFWDEKNHINQQFTEGFYVTKDTAIKFLETTLDKIGLSPREKNEFIMYWLPILEKNQKSIVNYTLTEERNMQNKLTISPKPDSVLRVAINIKKVFKKTNIKEQQLPHFNRTGFSVVEWGGTTY